MADRHSFESTTQGLALSLNTVHKSTELRGISHSCGLGGVCGCSLATGFFKALEKILVKVIRLYY
jgi:hypothetical protein